MMAAFSCLFDEQAQQVVEYLKEENRVLREQLHNKYGWAGCSARTGVCDGRRRGPDGFWNPA